LNYIIYLRNKKEEDYDGLEGNINLSVENKSFDWIPTKSTLYYESEEVANTDLEVFLHKAKETIDTQVEDMKNYNSVYRRR
jgi:hypothetical protein